MNVIAVIIGDYCSEIMPWWYCVLFLRPVSVVMAIGVMAVGAYLLTWRPERSR